MASTSLHEATQAVGRVDEERRQMTVPQPAGSSLKTRVRYEQEAGNG